MAKQVYVFTATKMTQTGGMGSGESGKYTVKGNVIKWIGMNIKVEMKGKLLKLTFPGEGRRPEVEIVLKK